MNLPVEDAGSDLIAALKQYDVFEGFSRLSFKDQENFSRWVAMANDDDSRWRRIDALVLALRGGFLQSKEACSGAATDDADLDPTQQALVAMGKADVLHAFFLLPEEGQKSFLKWITESEDPQSRHRRVEIFVSALVESPLGELGTTMARKLTRVLPGEATEPIRS